MGATKRPAYRVIAIDRRRSRDGRALEILGFYDPLTEPATVQLDTAKIQAWIGKGAQPSDTVVRLMRLSERVAAGETIEKPKRATRAASPKPSKKAQAKAAAAAEAPAEPAAEPAADEPAAEPETTAAETTPEPTPEAAGADDQAAVAATEADEAPAEASAEPETAEPEAAEPEAAEPAADEAEKGDA